MNTLERLVNTLRAYPTEANWFEFKHNNYEPEMIGQDISALANGAAFADKPCAYMIWGVHDKTHDIVGTDYDQYTLKVGNQEIESWLRNLLSKNAEFEFKTLYMKDKDMNEKKVVVLIIYKATNQTVTFKKTDYIRVGSYSCKLMDYPQMQAQLWDKIRNSRFEEQYAKQDLTLNEAIQLLDFSVYFDLKNEPIPSDIEGISHYLLQEDILAKQDNGLYAITNLGAILFAKKLSDFHRLERKAIRVVQYKDNSRLEMQREDVGNKGYAVGFDGLLKYVEALLPSSEPIEGAIRLKDLAYPMIALREAIANALIHQDFSVTGTGVVVEIFASRIEITNPGTPLVDVARIVDNPPKSRNEKLASLMRRLRMCEELGTGWDKIVISCELQQLPTPHIRTYDENTKVILFAYKDFFDLSPDDKLWACYMHACIKYIQGEFLTNSSLRERFGLKESSSASVSRLIKDAYDKHFIKKLEDTAPRYTKYIPNWA